MTTLLDPSARTALGETTQADVTGLPSPPPATLLQESWRDFIFSEIWTRPALDRRSRFLIALAGAACSSGSGQALDGYAHGALASGELTLAELREAALHLAVYAGWARGDALDAAVSRAAGELGIAVAPSPPIRAEAWDPQERLGRGAREFDAVMTFGGPPPATPYFEAGILNFVFGEMWHRDGLDQRSRRWITLVGVCESRAETPIKSHLHSAMASGNCRPEELQEFVLQFAVHAGWPLASLVQGAALAMIGHHRDGLAWDGTPR